MLLRVSRVSFFLVFFFFLVIRASVLTGVAPSEQHRYEGDLFTCDGKTIPMSNVNDDFCDCQDGTDEPGTSACSHRLDAFEVEGQAIRGFYCANRGFKAAFIPTSFVNDNICDCCDGSDEPKSDIKCENTCLIAGREDFLKTKAEIILHEKGVELKYKMIETAKEKQPAMKEELTKLQSELAQFDELLAKQEAEENRLKEISEEGKELVDDDSEDMIREDEETDDEDKSERRSDEERKVRRLQFEEHHGFLPEKAVAVYKEAKAETRKLRNDKQSKEDKIGEIEKLLRENFGEQSEYFALYGQSISVHQGEYNYVLRPFDSVEQSGTPLGTWSGWEDGYNKMRYTGGRKCWGAGEREATVTVTCGVETKLTDIDEPSTCQYTMTLTTPAACSLEYAAKLRESIDLAAHEGEDPIIDNKKRTGSRGWF